MWAGMFQNVVTHEAVNGLEDTTVILLSSCILLVVYLIYFVLLFVMFHVKAGIKGRKETEMMRLQKKQDDLSVFLPV